MSYFILSVLQISLINCRSRFHWQQLRPYATGRPEDSGRQNDEKMTLIRTHKREFKQTRRRRQRERRLKM